MGMVLRELMNADWIAKSLSRKLTLGLMAIMCLASLVFLAIISLLYFRELKNERATASMQLNLLLQASLENAMLKRDLSGLATIITRLGEQKHVRRVMIVNPQRKVRFSSDQALLQTILPPKALGVSPSRSGGHENGLSHKRTHFLIAGLQGEILRSVNPIFNKPRCSICHGKLQNHPVNGALIIDYEAVGLWQKTLKAALVLAFCGGVLIALALVAVRQFLQRAVIGTVQRLNKASTELASGKTGVHISCQNRDELFQLCEAFNNMARQLDTTLAELRTSKAFMQKLIDAIPDGIRVIDETYHIIMANQAYGYQQGLPMEQIHGSLCYEVSHGRSTPCPPSLVTCPLYELQDGGQELKFMHHHKRHIHTGRKGHKKEKSELFHVEISAAALETEELDKTGERQKRHYVIEAIRDLEREVKVTQEQRLSELGKLASGVAHEIHNPLGSVRIGLQALLANADQQKLDPEFRDYLHMVDGEVDKCIEVTKRLLDLSQPPSKNEQLVCLGQIIPDVVSLLKYDAEKKNIRLVTDLEAGQMRVLGTDSEMRMVILNLVQNAFHAMPDGGELAIHGLTDDHEVCVIFTDTGLGIEPDDLRYIFDPFFSRRADKMSGTGLGLTISKSIVERFRGHMEVSSELGKGTVFRIYFPRLADGGQP